MKIQGETISNEWCRVWIINVYFRMKLIFIGLAPMADRNGHKQDTVKNRFFKSNPYFIFGPYIWITIYI